MPISSIGVCSWSLQPSSPAELVKRVREIGVDRIQLALSPVVSQREQWGQTLAVLAEAEITVVSGMMAPVGEDYSSLEAITRTGGLRPNATWPANEAMARAMAVVAGAAGIPLVTFHAGFLPHDRHDPERQRMIERLRILAGVFADQGVNLALETGQESAATLLEVLDDIRRESVGINFDPANMILYNMGDPVEAIEALASRVMQVHLKDALPSGVIGEWGTEVPLGNGAVEWTSFFKILEQIPDPLEVMVERESGENRSADITAAIDFVRTHQIAGTDS